MAKAKETPEQTTTSQEIVPAPPAEETALVAAKSMEDMFAEDQGDGSQNVGAEDYAIPFITILQKNSPQVDRASTKFIRGADQSNFFNTVTGKFYNSEEPTFFIPCAFQKKYMRWHSRDEGGGLVGEVSPNDPLIVNAKTNARNQITVPGSNDVIIDTHYHYGIFIPPSGVPEWSVISMYSSQLKKSRGWNTLISSIEMTNAATGKAFNPPRYSHLYRLETVPESADTYNWFGWKITVAGQVKDPNLYQKARDFSKAVRENAVRISAPPSHDDVNTNDDNVPF